MTTCVTQALHARKTFYRSRGKRLLDVTCAGALLLLCMLPIMLIAVLIIITSGLPVIFRQTRAGLLGNPFTIFKFRTMELGSEHAGSVTVAGDVRVTRIGRFLRRFKLDELPQLWNVLLGDMSMVGPRPDVPEYTDTLTGPDREILAIRPGITGPATISFRNEEAMLASREDPHEYNRLVIYPAKVELNLQYCRTISLWSDLYWIANTALPFLGRPNGSCPQFLSAMTKIPEIKNEQLD